MSFFLRLSILAAALLASVFTGRADETLLSNLPSNDGGQGLVSSGTLRAVSFTTASTPFYVSTATMRLSNYISATDTALLTFRLDNANAPSATVYATLIAPSSGSNAAANFVFTTESAITLAGNTKYWLVIAAASEVNTFSWERSNPTVTPTGIATFGIQAISDNSGSTWSEGSNGPHSFAINGVPEPSSALLLGLGLAALSMARRRRR